ncbi:hypothetical protein QFC22_006527 [Naganishia vaughanmartiniae]|uniref:Uncharacterized protein n=1 Tax=Naganishia vaughanmartiniae TaxID=1424756 RepID=A0ACC2WJH8_9TREE|nr:hypothetical protein QFC22_006527 [Naganishia vaughanmartiniae]
MSLFAKDESRVTSKEAQIPSAEGLIVQLPAIDQRPHKYLRLENGLEFYFDVSSAAFKSALDQFAGFFSEPNFTASRIEHEAEAIQSEFESEVESDLTRTDQVLRYISSHDHPFHKFGAGNKSSLWDMPLEEGRDPLAELIAWWKKTYCAQGMKLVILDKRSLSCLESWVRQRFESVPARDSLGNEVANSNPKPLRFDVAGKFIFISTLEDAYKLNITFPVEDQSPLLRTKPGHDLLHLLGHECSGSILSYLRLRGWASSLVAGFHGGYVGFDLLEISIGLTREGFEHYDDVSLVVFEYISMLQQTPIPEALVREFQTLALHQFIFSERTDEVSYVMDLSSRLHLPIPREKLVSSKWLVEGVDTQAFTDLANSLTFDSCIAAVLGRDAAVTTGFKVREEPVFQTEFSVIEDSERFTMQVRLSLSTGTNVLEFMTAAFSQLQSPTLRIELRLPPYDNYIPTDLHNYAFKKRISALPPSVYPSVISHTITSKLWYKEDLSFGLPFANVFVKIDTDSPYLNLTPKHAAMARALCDLLEESVAEEIYAAEVAGIRFSIDFDVNLEAIVIEIDGYTEKIALFVTHLSTQDLQDFATVVFTGSFVESLLYGDLDDEVLAKTMEAPAYEFLRTKEHLGYRVDCRLKTVGLATGVEIMIQSALSTDYLEGRILAFLDHFKGVLETLEGDVYEQIRVGLIGSKSFKPNNVFEAGSRLWSAISTGSCDFSKDIIEAEALEKTSKKDILELFMTRIHPSAAHRKKFSIHLVASNHGQEEHPSCRPGSSDINYSSDFISISAAEDSKELLEQLEADELGQDRPSVADQHPAVELGISSQILISDIIAFKASLRAVS